MRLAKLDVLRAMPLLLILGHHMVGLQARPPEDLWPSVKTGLALWHRCGWVGVDLFFLLSGFLVSGLLFRESQLYGTVKPGRFLIRRGFKIYPAFYVFLIASYLLWTYFHTRPKLLDFLAQAIFIQNYRTYGPVIWDHTWTLAVEEHFYFMLALVLGLALRHGRQISLRTMTIVFLAVAGSVLALRLLTAYAWYVPNEYNKRLFLFPTHLRIDALSCGVYLAYLFYFHPRIFYALARRKWLLAILACALLAPTLYFDVENPFTFTIGYTLYYLGFAAILLMAMADPPGDPRAWHWYSPLAYIGAHSYSIYLWHVPVGLFIGILVKAATGWTMGFFAELPVYMAVSIGFGIFMAKIIEYPFLRIRDYLFPSRTVKKEPVPVKKADPVPVAVSS